MQLYEWLLPILEKEYGPEHRSVVRTINAMAGLYRAQGREDEATKLEARAAAIRAKQAQ